MHLFVAMLLRPLVRPAVGTEPAKTMEIRFFAPAGLVSNLDFVETIFWEWRRPLPSRERLRSRPPAWDAATRVA